MNRNLRRKLKKISPLVSVVRGGRKFRKAVRTKYYLKKYPNGHYLSCHGVDIFCDFNDSSYEWYDQPWPNLAFDQQVISALIAQSEGQVFVDVGAHFGFFTAYLSQILRNRSAPSTIIALEPDRNHFRCLQQTVSKCSNASTEILQLPFALSDHDGEIMMYRTDASCLHSYKDANARGYYTVGAISLDSLVKNHTSNNHKVAFIKIDIDGAEPLLFSGGAITFAKHKPIVFMEFSPVQLKGFGVSPQEFYNQLCDNFFVYWTCYQSYQVERVNHADYTKIEMAVGDAITDLVLSSSSLDFTNVHL